MTLVSASVLAAAPAAFAAADTTPPTVTIQSPSDGFVFDANGAWVTFTTLDDVGIQSWEVLLDGAHFYGGTTPGQVGVNLFVGHLSNGPHTLTVKALDTSNNEASVTRSFSVDYVEPIVEIASPQDGGWVRADSVTIEYNGADNLSWTVRADGGVIRSDSGYSGTSFDFTPLGWTDGSSHTIEVTGVDALGRSATRSVTVRADAAAPVVTIGELPALLVRSTPLGGTVSDASSGVASVQISFATRDGDACGATAFSTSATVEGGTWSAAMPGAASDGDFCLTARATDAVGNTADSSAASVSLDVTGPAAPTGLAPTGELLEGPTTLTWTPVADAEGYQYRLWDDPWSMESAPVVDVSSPSATLPYPLAGTWFWQVRGIDASGNVGDWSELVGLSVLGAPQLYACPSICRLVGTQLRVEWDPFPSAVGYTIQVTGTNSAGHPVVIEQQADGDASDAVVTLPSSFPTGTITVRLRAELDHEVNGSTLTDWSEPVNYLRFNSPRKPSLVSPAAGAYVDGDAISLAWTDDPSAMLWEVRISPTSDLDEDGGLLGDEGGTGGIAADPMILVVLFATELDGIPDGLRLADMDAMADCAALRDFLESVGEEDVLEMPCADGDLVVPDTLPDGEYFWQVRGMNLVAEGEGGPMGPLTTGPWSSVGRFIVGDAPVVSEPDGSGAGGTTPTKTEADTATAPGSEPSDEPTADPSEEPSDEPDVSGDGAGGGSSDGGEAAPETPEDGGQADDGFPVGWIIGGVVALIVLVGGGALIRFLVVRRS
jgi:hypothetical protein